MSSELFLCISQDEVTTPYTFKMTNINVYSFEEALYHCYHYWKQSYDEFLSDDFLVWVRDVLNLSFLASKIKDIAQLKSFSDKLMAFLSITDYLDAIQLTNIKSQLIEWEKRLEWERLKEHGDYLMHRGEPGRACVYYKKALAYGENAKLLNNLAIALMRLSVFDEAIQYLERALILDENSLQIVLNLAEAAIYHHSFEKALRVLKQAEAMDKDHADIQYLYGELNLEAGNVRYSIDYYERAYKLKEDRFYIFRITDIYVKLRQYDKALENLNLIKTRDKEFLLKQAEVYEAYNNVPAAIKCIERALMTNMDDVGLWTKLARYHRLDYDINRANSAILKALNLSPDNDKAKVENARIKKAMGKTKEYQAILNNVLQGFKRKYRDTMV